MVLPDLTAVCRPIQNATLIKSRRRGWREARQIRGEPARVPAPVRLVRLAAPAGPRRHGPAVPGADRHARPGEAVRGQAGAARDRRRRARAPFPRRGDGRAAAVARQPGVGVRRRHVTAIASSWRWNTSTAAICTRCGTAAPNIASPFPIEIAVHVIKELCRGLAYAHAFEDLALVHRDVSPGNVHAVVFGRGEADRLRAGDVDAQAGKDGAGDHLRQDQLPRRPSRRAASGSTAAPICTPPASCCGSC